MWFVLFFFFNFIYFFYVEENWEIGYIFQVSKNSSEVVVAWIENAAPDKLNDPCFQKFCIKRQFAAGTALFMMQELDQEIKKWYFVKKKISKFFLLGFLDQKKNISES